MFLRITNAQGRVEESIVNSTLILDTAAAADADIPPGCIQLWLDEAGNAIKVKVKYSDDTIKNGTVCTLS